MCDIRDEYPPNVTSGSISASLSKALKRLDRPKFERLIEVEDSKFISAIYYDPETLVLDAHLHTGDRYRYRDVSPMQFARVVCSHSVGQAFNTTIRYLPFKKLPRSR